MKQCISFIGFMAAYDSAGREVLYNILILYPHETGKANKNVSD
jgi:hypothetical protein